MNKILSASAAILVLSLFSTLQAANSIGSAGSPAPAWKITDLTGKTLASEDYTNQVLVLDFWATWCPPCRAEIPGLIELQKTYEKQGVQVVGISLDQGEVAEVKSFAKKYGMNYPVAIGDEKIQQAFGGFDAIPVTLVIDRQGNIAHRHLGLVEKVTLENEIKALLK